MDTPPTISVIIPTWNSAHTLAATITSCLNQTYSPLEILVCDDGSTDESRSIVEQFADPKVQWVSGEHSGTPGVPRNTGMQLAQGEWLAICDSDDTWLPEKLEKQMAAAVKYSCDAVCANAFIKINTDTTSKKVSQWNKPTLSFANLLKTNNIVCSSAMIHSSLYKKLGGFSEIVEYGSFADYIYWLRIATSTRFAFVNEPLIIYDDHPLTSMRSTALSNETIQNKVFNDFIKNNNPSIFTLMVRVKQSVLLIKKILKNSIKYLYKNE